MTKMRASTASVVASAALSAFALVAAAPASAASVTGSGVSLPSRIAVHLDLASGQMPENIVLEPNGTADVTLSAARQVAAITPEGAVRVLATLPRPADGGAKTPVLHFALTTGIVRATNGTLYFVYASGVAATTGVWQQRPGGKAHRIAALPATGLPNGLALDERAGKLYVTDSVLGKIFTVPVSGGRASVWSANPALRPAGFLGANGLKLHGEALWVTNLDKGTVLRIPIRTGGRPGTVRVKAQHLVGIDDFTFTGHGDDLLATLNGPSKVVLIRHGRPPLTVLTAADGLQNPTAVAVQAHSIYVTNAAYLTAKDPNLLLAQLPDGFGATSIALTQVPA